nr:hypothetical protein [Tanacetum cinerariifolium]
MRIVLDAELVGHGEQQRVRLGDPLVGAQLRDQLLGLGRIGPPEHRAHVVDHPDLVAALAPPEIGTVAIVHQREDRARHRYARLALMPRILPGLAVEPDLLGLLHVQRLAAFVRLEGGALQVHALARGPDGRRVRRRAP